jgi:hypothetical protein
VVVVVEITQEKTKNKNGSIITEPSFYILQHSRDMLPHIIFNDQLRVFHTPERKHCRDIIST